MPDILADAGSSLLMPPSQGGAVGQAGPPSVEQIRALISSGALPPPQGGSGGQNLTQFGIQPINPTPPVRMQQSSAQIPQGSFNSKGERVRAQKQALFGGIADITKKASDFFEDKKIRAMQMDTERLTSAMQGLNEAKASGDKEAIEHNTKIINDLMTDPKKVKAFQKAFNVNLLGESKDKESPEYKGMIAAYKKFGEDKAAGKSAVNPMAERLMGQMPQRIQANPQIAAQASMVKAGLIPSANAQLTADVAINKQLSDAQQKGYDRASKEGIAQTLANTKDKSIAASIQRANIAAVGRQGAAEIAAKAVQHRADKQYDGVMNNPHWEVLKQKAAADDKSIQSIISMTDKQMKALEVTKKELDKDMSKESWRKPWTWGSDTKQRLNDVGKHITAIQQQQEMAIRLYKLKTGNDLDITNPDGDPTKTDDSTGAEGTDPDVDLSDKDLEDLEKLATSDDDK